MALTPLKLTPGVNNVASPQLNEGGWEECNAGIRFFQGLPQKDGGYALLTKTLAGAGKPLWLYAWSTLSGIKYLAIACTNRINLYGGGAGVVQDITPATLAPATIPIALSVSAGSSVITIQDPVSSPSVGDVLTFEQPISLGGNIILGPNGGFVSLPTYVVSHVIDPTHYQILGNVNATVGVVNGGTGRSFTSQVGSSKIFVELFNHTLETGQVVPILLPVTVGGIAIARGNYEITVLSPSSYTIDFSPQVATSAQTVQENNGNLSLFFFGGGLSPNDILASDYTLGNWGQDLVACPQGGPIFLWNPTTGGGMSIIPDSPSSSTAIFVTASVQQIFAIGTIDPVTGLFDPMLVRWCDIGDFTDWIASTTNQAGSFRLSLGSRIETGLAFSLNAFIWSDTTLYSAQYLGFPLVWGFQPIDSGCGTNSIHDAGVLREIVYWKGDNQFFQFSGGGVQMIPCPVWDQVFQNLDRTPEQERSFCGANSWFNELRFFFENAEGEISFARLQLDSQQQGWTYGNLDRTAWIDASPFGAPIACDAEGNVYQHETGKDAAIAPLPALIKTGIIEIAEGDELTFIREFYPDIMFSRIGSPPGPGTVKLTLFLYRKSSQDPPVIKGPYFINAQTRSVRPRLRARGIQWQLESDDLGSWWRVGLPRYRGQPDGRN